MSSVSMRMRRTPGNELPTTARVTQDSKKLPRGTRSRKRLFCVFLFVVVISCFLLLFFTGWSCDFVPCSTGGILSHRRTDIVAPRDLEKHFIYVYDLPRSCHRDIFDSKKDKSSEEYYLTEKFIHSFLERNNVFRTTEPERAALFFIPLYIAQFLSSNCGSMVNGNPLEECKHGLEKTGTLVEKTLLIVQNSYQFWNQSGGKDHFLVLTSDNGRCSALPFVNPKILGSMFFLQLSGDQRLRSVTQTEKYLSNSNEDRKKENLPDIPCFEPNIDIVIPPFLSSPLISPKGTIRPITLLGRLKPNKVTEDKEPGFPTPHDGVFVHKKLMEIFQNLQPPGWDIMEVNDLTISDSSEAIICVCLPGSFSQWTSCLTHAILGGCIPLTFFRYFEKPWQNQLDYRAFSVNLDPDSVEKTPEIIEKLVKNSEKLEKMQEALTQVQPFFLYDEKIAHGAQIQVVNELRRKAQFLLYGEETFDDFLI